LNDSSIPPRHIAQLVLKIVQLFLYLGGTGLLRSIVKFDDGYFSAMNKKIVLIDVSMLDAYWCSFNRASRHKLRPPGVA
jgi:hypothetical protein